MDVYLDGAVFTKGRCLSEWCELLRSSIRILRIFHKRAKCTKVSWVDSNASVVCAYSFDDFVREIKNDTSEFATALSARDYQSLKNDFFTGFRHIPTLDVHNVASTSASLVWHVSDANLEVIYQYCRNGKEREVVRVSRESHFHNEEVCRVLYCNHPDVEENSLEKGYSVSAYFKHSKINQEDVTRGNEWINRTSEGRASQFLPKYKYQTTGYEMLVKNALMDAMKSGKYSEERMRAHVYDYGEIVGASNGEYTSKVHFCIMDGEVHIYPE